jgi:hypothetical protein
MARIQTRARSPTMNTVIAAVSIAGAYSFIYDLGWISHFKELNKNDRFKTRDVASPILNHDAR